MKAKLFLDTDIVLDLLGERVPFYDAAAKLATLADLGDITLVVSALSYSTVNYFLTKFGNEEIAKNKLRKFRVISDVSDVDETIIDKGLNSNFSDFEDSIQYYSALKAECQVIITRDVKDFKGSQIPVMTADEYLSARQWR